MPILEHAAQLVEEKLGEELETILIDRCVLGVFFTGVRLSNGAAGICFTPIKEIPGAVCCPSSAGRIFSPEIVRGTKVKDALVSLTSSEPLKAAVSVATLNALSSMCLFGERGKRYNIQTGRDALEAVDLKKERSVTLVGAIAPALHILKRGSCRWWVIEEDPRTLREDEMTHYVPFARSEERIRESDLLIITGVTLLNRTLEWILERARPDAEIALIGPTASMLPDPLFDRGVSVVGGVRVKKPDEVLDLLSMGCSGYHLFDTLAERIVLIKD